MTGLSLPDAGEILGGAVTGDDAARVDRYLEAIHNLWAAVADAERWTTDGGDV